MKRKTKNISKRGHSLALVQNFYPNVVEVIDASKPARVEVTPVDVRRSNIKSHKTCAMAVCCARTFHADGVMIGLTTAFIIKGNIATRYKLGNSIGREITSFDRKAGFAPGVYLLTVASPGARLGLIRSHNPKRHGKRNGNRIKRFVHYTTGVRTALSRLPEEGK